MKNGSRRRIRVVVDTNCWISFLMGKRTAQSLKNILSSDCVEIVYDSTLIEELLRTAKYPKLAKFFPPGAAQRLTNYIRDNCVYADTTATLPVSVCRDPKDNYLLSLAAEVNASVLISGDKDLLELGSVADCSIMRPADFETLLVSSQNM